MKPLSLDEAYARLQAPALPEPSISSTNRRAEVARIVAELDNDPAIVEGDFLAVLLRAPESVQDRYNRVQWALDAAGATLDNPGPLASRITATLNTGDELARILSCELRLRRLSPNALRVDRA